MVVNSRKPAAVAAWLICLGFALACGGCPPEFRPAIFEPAKHVQTHGAITEKHYRAHDGPQTINYIMISANGKTQKVPDGYVNRTSYCEVDGIDAVALQVRGGPGVPGIYIFQVDGSTRVFERVCDFSKSLHKWDNATYTCSGGGWDAKKKRALK